MSSSEKDSLKLLKQKEVLMSLLLKGDLRLGIDFNNLTYIIISIRE